ncbi:hypothetical protein GTR04_1559 [Trichophyton interdigitale]|uniref:Uncharacterized protein n=1 Tax=Trichophyton interdigitale TaxID=101480 RepID=A0A9P4YFJ1_9EURO|nr:hypothetical protein GY631_3849 [Trichophyton interdigitale]KAF3894565.1 hypothetical protein GY632_3701 [Trichophyton interdigitale]KAG8211040.1 hypothetical protein GTR04_1559 [Trichophyton interdigitale]
MSETTESPNHRALRALINLVQGTGDKQDDQTATGVLFFPWSTSAFSRDQEDSNIKCAERDRQQQYWGSKGLVAPASTLQTYAANARYSRRSSHLSQFESGESDGEKLEEQAGESAARASKGETPEGWA